MLWVWWRSSSADDHQLRGSPPLPPALQRFLNLATKIAPEIDEIIDSISNRIFSQKNRPRCPKCSQKLRKWSPKSMKKWSPGRFFQIALTLDFEQHSNGFACFYLPRGLKIDTKSIKTWTLKKSIQKSLQSRLRDRFFAKNTQNLLQKGSPKGPKIDKKTLKIKVGSGKRPRTSPVPQKCSKSYQKWTQMVPKTMKKLSQVD